MSTPTPAHVPRLPDDYDETLLDGGESLSFDPATRRWLPESTGVSHLSILASGSVTLPTEHPVLTIRADDPATLAAPEAPDGTVVTIHVAHGWENLTWAPGITITGDSTTTETWVVLVRKEGAWSALVSGSGGGGGMTGHGRPDGQSWPHGEPMWTRDAPIMAPLGTTYTDLDQTDGAVQWMVTHLANISWYDPETGTYPGMEDGPFWEVTIGQTEWWKTSHDPESPLTPPAGYDRISIQATRRGDWVDVEIRLIPSGIGQGVPVTVPEVGFYSFAPPQNFAPSAFGYFPIETQGHPDFVAAVGEPPQVRLTGDIRYLAIPSFEIGAYTDEYSSADMIVKAEFRIKDPLGWPVQMEEEPNDGGGGDDDDGGGGVAV